MAIKVFFNNSCSVCRLEINHYKKIADSNLEWVDITNNEEALKLTSKSQEELLRRLHVIDDGKVIGGAKAFVIIWSKIPKYNFLAKIFSIKPLFILFHYGYEIVAYFLFLKNKSAQARSALFGSHNSFDISKGDEVATVLVEKSLENLNLREII